MNERDTILHARVMRVAGIRALEAAARASAPAESLMERAGRAVAKLATTMADDRGGPVLILAGPGNNGGDALVAAHELHRRGIEVRVALLDERAAYTGDAAAAWMRWQEAAGTAGTSVEPAESIDTASLIVDGLFGIGGRAPKGRARDWIERVNAARCPVLAIDVPSGVDADTGNVAGLAVEADRTITFLADKPGLRTGDGLDHCGDVVVDLLGVGRDRPSGDDLRFEAGVVGALNRPALFAHALAARRRNSHKGSFGSVAVVGGHDGMVGAALLASRMALQSGAGRVYVRLLARNGPGLDLVQPELMLRTSLDGVDAGAWAIGPGLGDDDAAIDALEAGLAIPSALVLDADALNLVARHERLATTLAGREAAGLPIAVLTPHPLEAARLLGCDVKTVQADRIDAAMRLARRTRSIVVLKGAGSIVADPSGTWVVNTTGNPALATGGTGDVLCGLVAGLLAQKMSPLDGARAATWLHGAAADALVAGGVGPAGLTASELIPAIRVARNRLGVAS